MILIANSKIFWWIFTMFFSSFPVEICCLIVLLSLFIFAHKSGEQTRFSFSHQSGSPWYPPTFQNSLLVLHVQLIFLPRMFTTLDLFYCFQKG